MAEDFNVFHIGGSTIDISDFVVSIDSCKFQGTGRIRTASITLNAENGAFITNDNSNTTPIMNEFEKVKIQWIDDNNKVKQGIFEVDQELSQINQQGDTLLPLELKGREQALQQIKMPAFFQFTTPHAAIEELRELYNIAKGTDQAGWVSTIGGVDFNEAPDNIVAVYDFSSIWTIYDALMHIITRLNQPTGIGGGSGDFWSLVFDDAENWGAGTPDNIVGRIFVQGKTFGPIQTLISTDADPFHSLVNRIDSKTGTQVFVRGMVNEGSVPGNWHRFNSTVELINNLPAYNSAVTYKSGILVLEGGTIYEANQDVPVSTPPPSAEWTAKTAADIIGAIDYSEWTNGLATVHKNSCSNPENGFLAAGFDSPAFPDGNLVVREDTFFRDFVHVRAKDPQDIANDATLRHYLRDEIIGGLYNGFRVLVDTQLGTPTGDFAGNDRFGRPFADSMVIYTKDGEWIVFAEPITPTVQDKAISHCCVLQEGKTYEYNTDFDVTGKQKLAIRKSDVFRGGNPSGPFAWRDVCDAAGANDVFHHPKSITNTTGLISDTIRSNQSISSYLTNSAIRIEYEFSIATELANTLERTGKFFSTAIDTIIDLLDNLFEDTVQPTTAEIDEFRTTGYYDIGWWFALPFPFPYNNLNSISQEIGDIYGLGAFDRRKEFAALDIINANFSHDGTRGLNHADVTDMGGPFSGIGFLFNFDLQGLGGITRPLVGDIPFTMTVYDDLSQVWRADFNYRHLKDTQEIFMPWSKFTVNRPSRTPYTIDTALANFIHTPELEIRSVFEEKRVRLITWQLKLSYDDHDRYLPINFESFINILFGGGTVNTVGIIDGLRLVKQPFVSSGVEANRVINPDIVQATNTRNLLQLESIAKAQKDVVSHKYENYTLNKDGKCDLTTDSFVYLENPDVVKFNDRNESSPGANDGDANTRKLVVLSENHTFNAEGRGGHLTTFELVKRLEV